MRRFSLVLEHALAIALLCSTSSAENAAVSRTQDAPGVSAVRERLAEGDLAGALAASTAIDAPELRAEWSFHILERGGDLPGALAAAIRGLDAAPRNTALLVNATRCALALSEGELAERLSARLEEIALESDEPWPGFRAKSRELREQAVALAAREQQLARGVSRARVVSLAGLCAVAMLLVAFSRRASRA